VRFKLMAEFYGNALPIFFSIPMNDAAFQIILYFSNLLAQFEDVIRDPSLNQQPLYPR
jgi:hypothetical protein